MSIDLEELEIPSAPRSGRVREAGRRTTVSAGVRGPARSGKREKRLFFYGLARLLKGGVPVLRALDLVIAQSKPGAFRDRLSLMSAAVRDGASLSKAMEVHPSEFKPFEICLVRAGEMSGNLPANLYRLTEELKRQEEIREKIKEAVTYPLFILGMGLVTLFTVLFFVVPRLRLIYDDFGGKLPFVTSIVMRASEAAPFLLAAVVVALAACVVLVKRGQTAASWERWPLVGGIAGRLALSRSAFLLSTLLKSGVTLAEALKILADSMPPHRIVIERVLADVSQGRPLSASFRHAPFFGEGERMLLLASEESGTLPETLSEIAATASEDLSAEIRTVLKVLEPALILLIGLLVGALVIGMLLPITEIDLLAGE